MPKQTAISISSALGASDIEISVASIKSKSHMLFLLVIGITIKEPGPPIFFVEGIISLPEPTADLTGAPNLGCNNAAACSISPSTPTIAPFP